jgi:2-polyprenyl-6-methoxyphenol hydroxylase-like FAD-dependent oxidoreductase
MQSSPDVDVLIVGAGPTGLMLGNQLARRGIRPLIIDQNPGPSIRTKALGVQARTLEIYSHLGIAERAIELGTRVGGANMWVEGRHSARVPLGDIGRDLSPFPFVLILGQDDNERLLGDTLRHHGIDVQWETELSELVQEPTHVTATLAKKNGSAVKVRASWVAGCDGPRSAVREINRIGFPGAPYEHVFFIADTAANGPMVSRELNIFFWRQGFHLFFPLRGTNHWRVVGIVPPAMRSRDDLDFEDLVDSIRTEVGPDLSFEECHWFSTYRIHHRCAAKFRDRRCFLLGDAAHIHSPVGAQGMNTGLQDAYNLAWKLALVVSGRARETLLDSYEIERLPVAQRLLRTTDEAFSLVVSDSWLAGLVRTRIVARVAALAMRFDRARKLAFLTVSQIGIRYRDSPLSQSLVGLPESAPKAGDRFPWLKVKLGTNGPREDLYKMLDDTRFNLIAIGELSISGNLSDHDGLLHIHRIPDDPENDEELIRAGIPKPAFFLLRPDGHIGLAGTRLDANELARYFDERVELQSGRDI